MAIISWITTAVCLLGTILNVKKMNICFYLWLIGNIAWLCIDIYNESWSRAILDIVQGVFAVWGIIEWRKNKND